MELKLTRIARRSTYTIGRLFIDGVFFSDTLEDTDRDYNLDGDLDEQGEEKVYAQTAIPSGTYQIVVNWSNRFQRKMPRLLNVPGFDGILIHNGTTEANTAGCLLVGKNSIVGQLTESRETFYRLFDILSTTTEPIEINIT
jgi:hypothetical protein